MKLNTDNIDITLTAEQKTAINTALDALETALPFLISVTPAQKAALVKMGPKSQAFAAQALVVGKDNPDILPAGLSTAALDRDVAIFHALAPIRAKLEKLAVKVAETQLLAGSDWMAGAMTIYRSLRAHGEGAGLQDLVAELGQRFARASRTPVEPGDGTTGGGTATAE